MQPDQLIRLECLKLAAAQTAGPADTCAKAQAYTDFVRGVEKAGTPPVPTPAQQDKSQNKGASAGRSR